MYHHAANLLALDMIIAILVLAILILFFVYLTKH